MRLSLFLFVICLWRQRTQQTGADCTKSAVGKRPPSRWAFDDCRGAQINGTRVGTIINSHRLALVPMVSSLPDGANVEFRPGKRRDLPRISEWWDRRIRKTTERTPWSLQPTNLVRPPIRPTVRASPLQIAQQSATAIGSTRATKKQRNSRSHQPALRPFLRELILLRTMTRRHRSRRHRPSRNLSAAMCCCTRLLEGAWGSSTRRGKFERIGSSP